MYQANLLFTGLSASVRRYGRVACGMWWRCSLALIMFRVQVSAWRSFRVNSLKIDGVLVFSRPEKDLESENSLCRVIESAQAGSDL